jgi:Flp pilus assembly pilin Flp
MKNQRKRSKNAREHCRKGWWSAVALCVVGLLAAVPPRPLLAGQTPLPINISFSIGSISVQLDITKPVAQPASGLFKSTIHIHAHDETQTPPFNADLVATGQAADADTLVGGFLPAALIFKNDLLAGMTFQQAAADAQAKTGVTITFLNDATLAEYGLMLALIAVVCMAEVTQVQPGLTDDACAIRAELQAGIAAIQPQAPPDPCATIIP